MDAAPGVRPRHDGLAPRSTPPGSGVAPGWPARRGPARPGTGVRCGPHPRLRLVGQATAAQPCRGEQDESAGAERQRQCQRAAPISGIGIGGLRWVFQDVSAGDAGGDRLALREADQCRPPAAVCRGPVRCDAPEVRQRPAPRHVFPGYGGRRRDGRSRGCRHRCQQGGAARRRQRQDCSGGDRSTGDGGSHGEHVAIPRVLARAHCQVPRAPDAGLTSSERDLRHRYSAQAPSTLDP